MKKHLCGAVLALALCLSLCTAAFAAEDVSASGEQGVTQSILTQEQTAFSVTLPTALPVYMDADGTVTTAQNASITNNSFGPVEVEAVQVDAANGWSLTDFNTDFSKEKVGLKQFGFRLQDSDVPASGVVSPSHFSPISGGAALSLAYDANIAVQSVGVEETIAQVVFTVGWSDQEIVYKDFTVTEANRAQIGYTGAEAEVLSIPAAFLGADGVYYTVTGIADGAFYSCASLKELHIPGSVTSIGETAFGSRYNFGSNPYTDTTIYIDAIEGSIPHAPWGAYGATIVYSTPIPQDSVFRYAYNFGSDGKVAGLTVSGVKDKTLPTLTVPDTVATPVGELPMTKIASSAFQSNDTVQTISLGRNIISIASSAFHSLSSGLAGLTSINVDADNPAYTSIDGVLYSKDCTVLLVYPSARTGSYRIPDTVVTVNDYAFQEGKLSTITLGKNVKNGMDYYVDYYMMYSLENVFVAADNPYYSDIGGVLYNKDQTTLYKCPEAKAGAITVPSTVTRIATSAFRSCTGVTKLIIYRPSGSLTFQSWDANWGATSAAISWLG